MAQKKRNSSKKRSKKKPRTTAASEKIIKSITSVLSESCVPDQDEDNITMYEKENVDLLDTIDGIEYDSPQFQQDFPHLTAELGNTNLNYPMDAVRWEDEDCSELPPLRPEESTVLTLLQRSKSEEEAIEIIEFLKKRGDLTDHEASQLISLIKSKGLKAFQP